MKKVPENFTHLWDRKKSQIYAESDAWIVTVYRRKKDGVTFSEEEEEKSQLEGNNIYTRRWTSTVSRWLLKKSARQKHARFSEQ